MSSHESQAPSQAIRVSYGRRMERYAWLPIALLFAVMAVLWAADLRTEYECPRLQMVLSFLSRTLASFFIMYLAGRRFLVQGAPGLLLLGCGVAIWGGASFMATAVVTHDANLGVTVSNLGAWFSALCHLAGTVITTRPPRTLRAAWLWLGSGYLLALGLVALLTRAAVAGWLPLFFVQGQGGTLTRHLVLSSAIAMFVLAAFLMRGANRSAESGFGHWYSGALLLIAAGLLGLMVQPSRNTALDWTCRAAQYLGGVYMLIAALLVVRERYFPWITFGQAIGEARYRYGVAVTVVLTAVAARLAFLSVLGTHAPFVCVYPAVMLAALYGGLRPGLLATAFSALLASFFWIEPVAQLSYRRPAEYVSLAVFVLSCTLISFIAEAMHRARAKAAAGEAEVRFAAERVRSADALRESEEKYRLLFQNMSEGFALYELLHDKKGRPVDWRVLEVNDAYSRHTGILRERIVGRRVSELFPAAISEYLPRFAAVVATRTPVDFETFAEHVGRYHHVVAFPAGGNRFASIIENITERKHGEAALRASEELTRRTLQALPAHIAVIDGQGRIIAVNQAWTEFARDNGAAGSPAVAVGASYLEVCRRASDGKDALALQALEGIGAVLGGTCDQFSMEYPCHSPGQQRWFFMTVVSLGAGGGGGAVITHLNITERQQAEMELRGKMAELQAANEDLARFNRVAIDRELRMIELKKQVNALCVRAGLPPRHDVEFEENGKA